MVRFLNEEYIPVPCDALVPKLLRAAFTEEVVKLSVITVYKYIDFRENLETYLQRTIKDIQYPYEGYLVGKF